MKIIYETYKYYSQIFLKMDLNGSKWTAIDCSGINRTEIGFSERNRPNWTDKDQSMKWTKEDRYRPKWTELDRIDRS